MHFPHKTILIVDEDEYNRELLSMALELDGHKVMCAKTDVEAMHLLLDQGNKIYPDCVLSDQVKEALFELNKPVIFCSIFNETVKDDRLFAKLKKPVSLHELLTTVQRAVDGNLSSGGSCQG